MSRKTAELDLVNGPLFSTIMRFSLPLMATNILQMMFNFADTVVVGRFAGQGALAAVGATSSLVSLFNCLFIGMSMGTNVIVAREIGARKKERISLACHTSVFMAIICGLLLTMMGLLFSQSMLRLLSTPEDIISGSALYMRIYFSGAIFLVLYNFGSGILRAKGDTQRPFYYLLVSGILNVVLNLIFVIILHMSVAGVALATVISQAVSALLIIRSLFTAEDDTKLYPGKLRLNAFMVKEILRIGIPSGIQSMAYNITNIVVQSSINSFGSSAIVAGNTAAINIESFVYTGMMAFSNAVLTFTSQSIGAGRHDRIMKVMWLTMILNCGSCLLIAVIANLNSTFLLSLFTNSTEVMEAGKVRLFWVVMFLFINGILDIFGYALRGMGHAALPAVILIGGVTLIRLSWLLLVFPSHHTLSVIYMCYPISWTVASIITGIAFFIVHDRLMKQTSSRLS